MIVKVIKCLKDIVKDKQRQHIADVIKFTRILLHFIESLTSAAIQTLPIINNNENLK